MFDALLPDRSAEDLIAGVVRVQLGRAVYALPELPMDATDEWASRIDAGLTGLFDMIDGLGDTSGLAPLFLRSREFEADLLAALKAYDRTDVLPTAEAIRGSVTHTQVLFAVLGVWATTASPLGALVVAAIRAVPSTSDSTELAPTSGLRETLASILPPSDEPSPTASSSTPSRTSTSDSPTSTNRASRRSASGRSSRTTARRTTHGSARPPNGADARSASPALGSSAP